MDQVIIFDGVCGLCNKSVDILIEIDTEKIFTYTSLQGEFVKTLDIEPNIDSILFYKDDTVYYKSTAILKIFQAWVAFGRSQLFSFLSLKFFEITSTILSRSTVIKYLERGSIVVFLMQAKRICL